MTTSAVAGPPRFTAARAWRAGARACAPTLRCVDHNGPRPHGPVIANVIPSMPVYGRTLPVPLPSMLTNSVSPSGLKRAPASSPLLRMLTREVEHARRRARGRPAG